MTYELVEAQFHTVVRLLSDFDATNTSAGKYTILADTHTSRQWVISRPGAILSRERVAVGGRTRTLWSLDFTLFHAFENTLDETIDAIRTARDALITHLDAYPTLNQFAGVVTAIGDESGAQVDVLVHIGDGDHTAPLWARISRKSVHLLGLAPGIPICAFVKSAALDRHSLGRSAAAGRFVGHHD